MYGFCPTHNSNVAHFDAVSNKSKVEYIPLAAHKYMGNICLDNQEIDCTASEIDLHLQKDRFPAKICVMAILSQERFGNPGVELISGRLSCIVYTANNISYLDFLLQQQMHKQNQDEMFLAIYLISAMEPEETLKHGVLPPSPECPLPPSHLISVYAPGH